MNERIEQLALIAQKYVEDNKYDYDIVSYHHGFAYRDKFAELIVKECMSMCDETQANYLKHRKATINFDEKNIFAEGEAASDKIKYKMKKHFGVE